MLVQNLTIGILDDLRAVIWPLLLGLDPNPDEKIMSLDELANHNEYNQVKLDVDRSLKRFPPGKETFILFNKNVFNFMIILNVFILFL